MAKYGQFRYSEQVYGPRVLSQPKRPNSLHRLLIGILIRGSWAKYLTWRFRQGQQQKMKYYVTANPQTATQQTWRAVFADGVVAAKTLDPADRTYPKAWKQPGQTWFTLFMRDYLNDHYPP